MKVEYLDLYLIHSPNTGRSEQNRKRFRYSFVLGHSKSCFPLLSLSDVLKFGSTERFCCLFDWLIHSFASSTPGKIVETWDALIHMQKQGKIRSIGVSNFGVQHLEALKEHGRPMPTVNQIEMHPMKYQDLKPNAVLVLLFDWLAGAKSSCNLMLEYIRIVGVFFSI